MTAAITGPAQAATSGYLFVSPKGSDSANGTTSSAPLRTLQEALDRAQPGTTIHLQPGVHVGPVTTRRSGTASNPIKIIGPESGLDRSGRYQATLFGSGRVVNINHSHYVLDGFTIDGQQKLVGTVWPTRLSAVKQFKDGLQGRVVDGRLVYVGSAEWARNLTNVVVRNMYLHGAGGECIRFRNNTTRSAVVDSVISWCGLKAKGDGQEQYRYHNGEGVYLGTSPKSTSQPMYANDATSHNTVARNVIRTFGSECFEVKENAHDNYFSNNSCRANDEPVDFGGSLVELRGHANQVSGNQLRDSRGWGVKLKSDATKYDLGGNTVTGNQFFSIDGSAIRLDQARPGRLCGNTFDDADIISGKYASAFKPSRTCN